LKHLNTARHAVSDILLRAGLFDNAVKARCVRVPICGSNVRVIPAALQTSTMPPIR